jgi:hypothetical protein
MSLARPFASQLARADADARELQNSQLGIANTHDELAHFVGVLAAQRDCAFAVDQPSQICASATESTRTSL